MSLKVDTEQRAEKMIAERARAQRVIAVELFDACRDEKNANHVDACSYMNDMCLKEEDIYSDLCAAMKASVEERSPYGYLPKVTVSRPILPD